MSSTSRSYQESKRGGDAEGKNSEGKHNNEEEEVIVSENVLPALMEFISSRFFRDEVNRFAQSQSHLFTSLGNYSVASGGEGKGGEPTTATGGVLELTHEHKDCFDDYQRLLEDLFENFAEKQHITSRMIYQCCQDTGWFSLPLYVPCLIFS